MIISPMRADTFGHPDFMTIWQRSFGSVGSPIKCETMVLLTWMAATPIHPTRLYSLENKRKPEELCSQRKLYLLSSFPAVPFSTGRICQFFRLPTLGSDDHQSGSLAPVKKMATGSLPPTHTSRVPRARRQGMHAVNAEQDASTSVGPHWFSVAPFAHKGRWRNFHVFGALSLGAQFQHFSGIFLPIFLLCR